MGATSVRGPEEATAVRVGFVSIAGNVVLTAFKLVAGLVGHSSAMVSDAIHSLSDVLSTVIVIVGVKLAAKESDRDHPYGHERLECVAAVILAMMLFVTGLGIGYSALRSLLAGTPEALPVPGAIALVAAVVSIVAKEAMFWYTRFHAKKIDSSALMADAWHHRSDSLSSVGALLGIGAARLGFPAMDAVASLVVFLFIAKASVDIFRDAIDKMVDHAVDPETEAALRDFVVGNPDVAGVDLIQTRVFGNKIYVDLEIRLPGTLSLLQAHEVAERVHSDLERRFPKVKHIMIHVNPA